MKTKAALVALFIGFFVNAQHHRNEKIKGNGNQVTINRTTQDYDEILVTGSFNVDLVAGKEGNITLSGEENILDHIKTEVVGNKLKIYFENNISLSYKSSVKIVVPFEKINKIAMTGSGDITSKNVVEAESLELKLAGSGDMKIETKSQNLEVELAGSGDATISGETNELTTELEGSGNLNCGQLVAQNTNASLTGSGDMKVNCKNNFEAKVTGSGTIKYKGKPNSTHKSITGSGDIESY